LLMAGNVPLGTPRRATPQLACGGRFSGVQWWPDLGVHRGTREIVTNTLVRDASFRFRVVEQAYDGRCALTGVRLTNGHGRAEVDAAHIQPVAAGGPDATRNGLALMKSMHWAFDRGLVSLSDDGGILTVDRGLDPTILKLLPGDQRAFLPEKADLRPHGAFLRWHREHVFKGQPIGTVG